jgi:hypothetical protein
MSRMESFLSIVCSLLLIILLVVGSRSCDQVQEELSEVSAVCVLSPTQSAAGSFSNMSGVITFHQDAIMDSAQVTATIVGLAPNSEHG